ncbi:MAG: hypothetical protein K8S16_13345 [Bacteroidales bacterium]|nr:hypothetical protein [Bacteroidales bacterium]
MLLIALICIYSGHILYRVMSDNIKRKVLKVGDVCRVYIGERKLSGFVIRVNHEVDILVLDRVFRFKKNQVYA